MVAKFIISIKDKKLQALLTKADKKTRNLTPVFEGPIRRSIAVAMERQFTSRGSFFGTPWAPLRPFTLAQRRKRGRGKQGDAPLRDTDRLFRSITRVTDPEGIRVSGPSSLRWGTRVPYAYKHQVGFTSELFGREVEVPARPMLPETAWPPEVRKQWVEAIIRHVKPKGL